MKILLVYPLSNEPILYPFLGLGYLATYVRQIVDDIEIFIPKKTDTKSTFLKKIKQFKPDLIGLSMYSLSFQDAKKTIKLIRHIGR